jgi:prepilin-type N-terminal cleavage/methylation domain-containing protein
MKKIKNKTGFTLMEMLMVISIMIVLTAAFFSFQSNLVNSAHLISNTDEIVQTLRLARSSSITRYRDSGWGVFFDADKFILFKGDDYATRDPLFDEEKDLPNTLSISNISLNGGTNYIAFEKINGETTNYGSLQLIDNNKIKIVTINQKGLIEQNEA